MNVITRITLLSYLIFSLALGPVLADTASLLPMPVQQFFDNSGNPLTSGTVTTYQAGTSTLATTWKDSAESVPNTNPIKLDAGGKAIIYGSSQTYRQVVKDRNGNLIWDAVTAPGGGGSSPTNVGDGNLVGTILPWSGLVAPAQYVFAYGQELARTTYSAYYTAVTQQLNVICSASSNILTGLSDTTSVRIGSPVELSLCVPPGTTVTGKTTATITLSNPSNVSINSVGTFFPWGNGNGSTTFNVPDLRGYTPIGRDNMGGSSANRITTAACLNSITPDALGAVCGNTGGLHTQTIAELAAHTHTVVDPGHTHTYRDPLNGGGATQGGTTQSNGGSSATGSSTTGVTNTITGSNVAFSIVQPSVTLNYIAKVIPDVSISTASVVTQISAMTGSLSCGLGLTCANQTISVNAFGDSTTAIKVPVDVATTGNIGLFGLQTIDGIELIAGNRVLVKDQITQSENGIYVVSAGAWFRATDFDSTGEVVQGTSVRVALGNTNARLTFTVSTANVIIMGSSSINFYQAFPSIQIGTASFGSAFSSGTLFGASNTSDTSWTSATPVGIVASHGGFNALMGFTLSDNTGGLTLPTGVTGSARINTNGNIGFGVYGQAELTATGGGIAVAGELTCLNSSGHAPDTSLPQTNTWGTANSVCNALQVTAGGGQNSSIGISLSNAGGFTDKFNTGIYLNPSSFAQYGIYVDTSLGSTASGVFMGNVGIFNKTPFSPFVVTAAAGDSFEVRVHHSLASGPTLVATDTGSAGGALAPLELWASQIYLDANTALPVSGYLNFGTTFGSSGYGLRDAAGTIQVKNSGGAFNNVAYAGSALTSNAVLYGGGSTAITAAAVNATGTTQYLSQVSSGAPVFAALPGAFSGFANPTASIGLTAVNGTATTAMRSDAAPALASTIAAAGPIGSATVVPIVTFNAAGQLTTVTSATITPAIGSITGLGTGVATALGNTAGGAGGFALASTNPYNLTGDVTSSGNATTLATTQAAAHTWSATQTFSNSTSAAKFTGGNVTIGTSSNLPLGATALTVAGATSDGSTFAFDAVAANGNTIFAIRSDGAILVGASAANITFPSTSATLARTDAAQTFTGLQTFASVAVGGNITVTGTTSPTFSNGVGGFYASASNGLQIQGQGSFADIFIKNSAGATVMFVPTGTTTAVFQGQIQAPFMTQTATAQSGTVCYNSGTGAITYDATLGCLASTIEVKNNWTDFEPEIALTKVLNMRAGKYFYKKGLGLPTGEQIGFNAQQMETVDDRLVAHKPNSEELLGVRYQQASALYAPAIQALLKRIKILEDRIK